MERRRGLATRKLSVCLSVSNAWIVKKNGKDLSRFLYHTKDLAQFSEKKNGWWGYPFYVKFWVNRPPLPLGAKSPIFNRYSLVALQP